MLSRTSPISVRVRHLLTGSPRWKKVRLRERQVCSGFAGKEAGCFAELQQVVEGSEGEGERNEDLG